MKITIYLYPATTLQIKADKSKDALIRNLINYCRKEMGISKKEVNRALRKATFEE